MNLDLYTHLQVLDRGALLGTEQSFQARRMIMKLSIACDKLPSSLLITGIRDRDEHATFGGGFGDIYRAIYGNRPVALKRMRVFQRGTDLHDLRRVSHQFIRQLSI